MFNRANKITSLLLAAAAVASFVPATGVNAATRLSTKEGTINDAVAFNGKYIYDGYKSENDDKAVWYNNGEKDVQVTDYDDEDYDFSDRTYGEKYVIAEDGSSDDDDSYLVDLTSGKVLDETLDDKKDSTASAVEKAIKKTDKFDGETVDKSELTEVKAYANFQEPWYYVDKTISEDNNNDGQNDTVRIFTNESGKYVTADQLANIYAYSSKQKKVVKINKFGKENTDAKLTATINKAPEVIAQDKDYLYAMVNVKIVDDNTQSVAEATKAKATIDFSAAKYEMGYTVTEGNKQTYSIDYTGTNTVIIGDKTYTAGTDSVEDVQAALSKISGYKAKLVTKVSDTTGTFTLTAEKSGVVSTAVVTGTAVSETTPGTDDTKSDTANKGSEFKVGGETFTYDANAATATTYKSESDLKNKVIAKFAAAAPAGYDFDASTCTFTASAAGAKSVEDVKADLGSVKDVVAGKDAGREAEGKVTYAWYLQKISKAQGDKDDEAYMPKSVESFLIDNKSVYDNGDCSDAYDWLISGDSINSDIINVQVDGKSLYVYEKNSSDDNAKVYKLDLTKIKEDAVTGIDSDGSKLDGYVVKKDGDTDHDYDTFDVDSNGILWLLDDGKIVKFDKKDKTDVYSCDSGFDSLNVYDENNLIAWNEDDERYTTVTEGKKQTLDDAAAIDPDANKPAEVKTGWQQDATTGDWTLLGADGTALTGWQNVGGAWYYLDPTTTIMAKGWKQINGTWYLLDSTSGAMKTGWYYDGYNWYYLEPVNTNGAMKTGWFQDTTGTWYYADQNGHMLSNTVVDGYVLSSSGAWVK